MTRILMINTSDNKGGAARLVLDIKSGLNNIGGFETTLFVKEKHNDDKSIFLVKKPNSILSWFSDIFKKDLESLIYNKLHYLLSNDIEFFNNKNLLSSKEYREADIIHCHNLHNSYFNLKSLELISKTKPVLWSLHDMWSITPHEAWIIKNETNKTIFAMEAKPNLFWNNREYLFNTKRKIYENSKLHIVATSKWFENILKTSILKNQKIYYIPNGIDENIYKKRDKREVRKELKLSENKIIISFMASGGSHNPQKGWKYAKEVIEHYKGNKDILFLCVGGNKKDMEQSTGNILYLPYVNDELEYAKYYNASDIFFNPSEAEAFCLALVQALASEIAVVTFNIGIAEEVIDHKKSGYLAKYQDTKDLISGIDFILNQKKEDLEKLGTLAREKVLEKFTKKQMIESYISLYKKILVR